VGGLKEDLPEGWELRADEAIQEARDGVRRDLEPVMADESFRSRTRGLGVLDRQVAEEHGVSGPIARASGLDLDLRRDDPYLGYGEIGPDVLRIVTRSDGDVLARFECLLEQVHVSLDLAGYCLARLAAIGPGPVNVRLPKVVKAPEGETYAWTENPLGINGYYLVSRGERTPWRLKLRSASFNNVQVLSHVLPGCHVADLVPILCSMFFVVGDVDK
jgi:NADH-quinone oxidoreductase subunit D